MTAYYNEFDPFAAAWLRELIKAGLIADGDVDERSIHDVRPEELKGYTQCHFFAGIGGWSYALRLAGWPDDRPVWTGSCPCQPFSAAGKQTGTKDDRHLWPEFFRLIRECRPDAVFGEQVAAAIGLDWLDHVSTDLEGEGYAIGSVVLGAHSVGAPHIRQRLWFVAESNRLAGGQGCAIDGRRDTRGDAEPGTGLGGGELFGELADPSSQRRQQDPGSAPRHEGEDGRQPERDHELAGDGENGVALGDTVRPDGARLGQVSIQMEPEQEASRSGYANPWAGVEFIGCADGKARPIKPEIFPLAHGIPNRVGLLRGAGNAIVPELAAEVIRAYREAKVLL